MAAATIYGMTEEAVVRVLEAAGVGVTLVGSRSTGSATPLSDWDYRLESSDNAELAVRLPSLCRSIETLAAQWDRLTEHATYMLMLPGARKIDLFPGDERRPIEPPWRPGPDTIGAIDAHFWDWTLWLGAKTLAGHHELVVSELEKMHEHLLGPLGVRSKARSITESVHTYLSASAEWEHRCDVALPTQLRNDVLRALREHHVLTAAPDG